MVKVKKIKRKYYRYTKVTLWTDADLYAGFEIKTHIFSYQKVKDAKKTLSYYNNKAKNMYDTKRMLEDEVEEIDVIGRRRIGYEMEEISKSEFKGASIFTIITRFGMRRDKRVSSRTIFHK